MATNHNKWLLLIHNIPPKPDALRVKIWRRLQQVGAVPVKQSVYALPPTEQSREDFNWILKEIVDGGGEGSILEVQFLDGLNDQQIITLFQESRQSDYEKIVQEAGEILSEGTSEDSNPSDHTNLPPQLSKLQRRLDHIISIDFFRAPQRSTAENLLGEIKAKMFEKPTEIKNDKKEVENLKGKTWVTRKNIFIDRIASGWLIRRFVDDKAKFKYVAGS